MKDSLDYIEFLADKKKADITMLDEEDLRELCIRLTRETATKFLPKIEEKDYNRQLMFMVIKWMETGDECLGYQVLQKIEELVIKAFEPIIEDHINTYHEGEAKRQRESEEHRKEMQYEYYRGRI